MRVKTGQVYIRKEDKPSTVFDERDVVQIHKYEEEFSQLSGSSYSRITFETLNRAGCRTTIGEGDFLHIYELWGR